MIYILLNAVPILAATIAGLAFGWLYLRFFKLRIDLRRVLPVAFPAEFWFASILAGALILAPSRAGVWTMAFGSAFVIWLGFVVPVLLVTHRLRGVRMRAALIDCGHWLGTMLVQAAVLQSIGLVAPPVGS